MQKIHKPWGYEIIWAETENYVGKLIFINKDHRLSLQLHDFKEESILVQTGLIELEIDGNTENRVMMKLSPGESYHITPKTVHRITAVTDAVIVEVSTPELDDVVRLEDDYGRIK